MERGQIRRPDCRYMARLVPWCVICIVALVGVWLVGVAKVITSVRPDHQARAKGGKAPNVGATMNIGDVINSDLNAGVFRIKREGVGGGRS